MTDPVLASVVRTLDLKGLPCPIAVVKVAKAIKEIEVGQSIEVFISDPCVMEDIPAWTRKAGHNLVVLEKVNGHFRFVVRRKR